MLSAVLLAASACTGGTQNEQRTAASAEAADINAADRDELADGGTLEWGINEFPAQWNPHHADGNLATVHTVMDALLPTPFEPGPDGDARPDPDYVLGADLRRDGGGQVLTLELNPEAHWSDGTPITWKDYRATAEALAGGADGYKVRGEVGYDRIASVERGADRFEAVVSFDEPFSEYPSLFDPLLPARYAGDPDSFDTGYLEDVPLTAGPFAFAGMDRKRRTVTLERSADWWGDPAKLDEIVFRTMDGEALTTSFLEGGVDAFELPVDAAAFERASSADGGEVRTALGPDYRHITLNGESPALSDVRVRHALFLGIDREALTDAALEGVDWSAEPLGNHFLLEGLPGYTDNSGEWGERDTDRAAELLDEAGWKAGDGGTRTKDGEPLALRYLVPRGHAPAQSEAEMVQAMLEEIGVAVEIEPVGGDELFSRYVLPGDYDLVSFVNTGGDFPVSASLPQWASPAGGAEGSGGGEGSGGAGEPDWRSNVGRISSPEIDAAMEEALAAPDAEAATAAVNEADRLLWEAGHTLPLYQRPQLMAARTDLANIGAPGFRPLDYADIGYLKKG
ncbi:ABC transporter family substrate-binding protein [Nocardiopsis potens]|uniref:ABC transporter family substrate-binding protein n=1 Tax=Nocardiopsis potens TaxID=1246458 RepID=UPI00034AFB6A|nr:ABC transporter family substrate-binding protein [Nocardiopsis potens]